MSEKAANIEAGAASPASDLVLPGTERTQDTALDFIKARLESANATLHSDPAYARRLRRKVDLLVIPFLMLCYVLNFLDKVLLNYSAVMGLTTDLKLQGNDFTNAATAFYIAVVVAMFPNIWLLQRLPVGKWLGISLAGWGICTACHAALHNYSGLLAVRIFSGICEAAIPSALMLLSSQWYTRSEQAVRFAYWYCGMGVGQIFGGLFSWAFQHVGPGAPLAGWRIMFLVIGLFTILVGIAIIFCVPDTPMKACFLTDEEKVNLLEHVKTNQAGIENRHFQPYQLKEGALDFQLWCMFIIVMFQGTGGGVVTTYSASLLASFGFSPQRSALLNMPSGVFNITSTLFCGIMSRYFGRRFIWTIIVTLLGVMGAALLSWMPSNNQSGSLAGIWLVNLIVGATPTDYQWVTNNTAGHTKRAFITAMMNLAFALGNIIGPQTFQAKDAPEFQPAKITVVCTWSCSALLAVTLVVYYRWQNNRRATQAGAINEGDAVSDTKAFAGLTDKQNKSFRYTY